MGLATQCNGNTAVLVDARSRTRTQQKPTISSIQEISGRLSSTTRSCLPDIKHSLLICGGQIYVNLCTRFVGLLAIPHIAFETVGICCDA